MGVQLVSGKVDRFETMGVAERRAREKEELRQEILAAARELFVKEGFANVSMRRIAEKIEYSPTTIYLYFEDKHDLLDCIVEERLLELCNQFLALDAEPARPPVESLRTGLRKYVDYWLRHPQDFRVVYMTDLKELDPQRPWRCQVLARTLFERLLHNVRRCVEAGVLETSDVNLASQAIWAAVYGIISLLVMKPHFPWVDQDLLIQSVIDSAINGLKVPTMAVV
jgi:AcrR family transcriptional regulator